MTSRAFAGRYRRFAQGIERQGVRALQRLGVAPDDGVPHAMHLRTALLVAFSPAAVAIVAVVGATALLMLVTRRRGDVSAINTR